MRNICFCLLFFSRFQILLVAKLVKFCFLLCSSHKIKIKIIWWQLVIKPKWFCRIDYDSNTEKRKNSKVDAEREKRCSWTRWKTNKMLMIKIDEFWCLRWFIGSCSTSFLRTHSSWVTFLFGKTKVVNAEGKHSLVFYFSIHFSCSTILRKLILGEKFLICRFHVCKVVRQIRSFLSAFNSFLISLDFVRSTVTAMTTAVMFSNTDRNFLRQLNVTFHCVGAAVFTLPDMNDVIENIFDEQKAPSSSIVRHFHHFSHFKFVSFQRSRK